jgi:hypothetical protein
MRLKAQLGENLLLLLRDRAAAVADLDGHLLPSLTAFGDEDLCKCPLAYHLVGRLIALLEPSHRKLL